eukprot:TRINITY_DN23559_c0_g1_i1.p1 TRINITY_DN23559_c0_g1~~TRINITY_DN23559_c0_g1_i1.p1  ORF type:complete len:332 (+),score=67.38 TRINITY_DN23559_c0_g1_i1:950-1945(+)
MNPWFAPVLQNKLILFQNLHLPNFPFTKSFHLLFRTIQFRSTTKKSSPIWPSGFPSKNGPSPDFGKHGISDSSLPFTSPPFPLSGELHRKDSAGMFSSSFENSPLPNLTRGDMKIYDDDDDDDWPLPGGTDTSPSRNSFLLEIENSGGAFATSSGSFDGSSSEQATSANDSMGVFVLMCAHPSELKMDTKKIDTSKYYFDEFDKLEKLSSIFVNIKSDEWIDIGDKLLSSTTAADRIIASKKTPSPLSIPASVVDSIKKKKRVRSYTVESGSTPAFPHVIEDYQKEKEDVSTILSREAKEPPTRRRSSSLLTRIVLEKPQTHSPSVNSTPH